MQTFAWLLPELSQIQWAAHILIFLANIGLFLLARPVVQLIQGDGNHESKIKMFKSLNILVIVLHAFDLLLLRLSADYQHFFINVGLSLMTIYAAMFFYTLFCALSKRRFGNKKVLDDSTLYLDTYSTRLVDLILLGVMVPTAIYVLIKIWGADSLLEATGIFGILAALLAFSSSIWAPDIISGLIILNTQMLEDGDVVIVDGYPDEYIINKVTLFYVVLYDVRNNHRTLMRNSQFTQRKIDNLSKLASTDGVRQAMTYNIGYPTFSENTNRDERTEELKEFTARVDKMFDRAFRVCAEENDIKVNENSPFEWALTETGDYALEYTLWVYLERIPNTKITATIRKHLMGTMHKINEEVFASSVAEGIDLATPDLSTMTIDNP